jgi:hypothetical protein
MTDRVTNLAFNLPIPESGHDFDTIFSTREACLAAVINARWPKGFACPACGHRKAWLHHKRPILECSRCGKQTCPLAETMFANTKLPLPRLFKLCYLIVASKAGISELELARQAGVSPPTATLWKRKLRFVMARRDKTPLEGIVETDETIIGGRDADSKGRKLGPNKALVVISVEDDNGKCGRVRLQAVDTASREDLRRVVAAHVKPGSTLRTDGWTGYKGVPGVRHKPETLRSGKQAHVKLPLVHRVASLVKRHILGILHGSWHPEWLGWMLEDWEYRFNRRNAGRRPLLFERLLEWGATERSPTRKDWHDYTTAARELQST